MTQPIYLYIDCDDSKRRVVRSAESPTLGDRQMVSAGLAIVLQIDGDRIQRLQCDGRWADVSNAEIISDPENASGDSNWHG